MTDDAMPIDPDRLRDDLHDVYRQGGSEAVNALIDAELAARFPSTVACPTWCDDRDDHPWALPLGGPDPDPDHALERTHTADLVTLFGPTYSKQRLTLALSAEQTSDPLQSVTATPHVTVSLYGEIDGLTPSSLRHLARELEHAADFIDALPERPPLEELQHVTARHAQLRSDTN